MAGPGIPYRGHASHTEQQPERGCGTGGKSEAHGHELSFSPSGYRQRCMDKRVCAPSPSLSSSRVHLHWRAPGSSGGTRKAELGHLSPRKEGGSHWPRPRRGAGAGNRTLNERTNGDSNEEQDLWSPHSQKPNPRDGSHSLLTGSASGRDPPQRLAREPLS